MYNNSYNTCLSREGRQAPETERHPFPANDRRRLHLAHEARSERPRPMPPCHQRVRLAKPRCKESVFPGSKFRTLQEEAAEGKNIAGVSPCFISRPLGCASPAATVNGALRSSAHPLCRSPPAQGLPRRQKFALICKIIRVIRQKR